MNKLIIISVLLTTLSPLSAYAAEDHGDVIAQAQEIISSEKSCDDLNDEDLEALGEYFMEQMHPGEQHEVMDTMMGGEGSESLRLAHINMGQAFYCGTGTMGMGMMGSGMMGGGMLNSNDPSAGLGYFGSNNKGGGSMMGFPLGGFGFGNMAFGGVWMLLFWGLIILGIVWLVRFLASSNKASDPNTTPLSILKERYAKGEIKQEEFEKMKKTLT